MLILSEVQRCNLFLQSKNHETYTQLKQKLEFRSGVTVGGQQTDRLQNWRAVESTSRKNLQSQTLVWNTSLHREKESKKVLEESEQYWSNIMFHKTSNETKQAWKQPGVLIRRKNWHNHEGQTACTLKPFLNHLHVCTWPQASVIQRPVTCCQLWSRDEKISIPQLVGEYAATSKSQTGCKLVTAPKTTSWLLWLLAGCMDSTNLSAKTCQHRAAIKHSWALLLETTWFKGAAFTLKGRALIFHFPLVTVSWALSE